jgi:hypothetical protein
MTADGTSDNIMTGYRQRTTSEYDILFNSGSADIFVGYAEMNRGKDFWLYLDYY